MKKFALAAVASVILSACGGGSSDSEPAPTPQPPENQAPTVSISSESNYNEQTIVSITANATDSDGNISSYAWSQTSDHSVSLIGSDSATLSFTAPTLTESATLGFEVTVTDNDGATATSTVSVTIDPVNEAPTIFITAEMSVNEQTEVTLSSTITDTDGSISEQMWTQMSGTNITIDDVTASDITFTTPTLIEEETLTFELSATDNEGATSTETVSIQVLPVNAAPVAVAEAAAIVNPDVVATVSGMASSDTDGTVETYTWTQTAGTEVILSGADSNTLTFTPSTAIEGETLTFELTVADNEGATHIDSVNVYINEHPVAAASKYQIVETGNQVSIDAIDSTDDGQILEYSWTQTVGTSATIENTNTAEPTFTTNFADDEKITFEVTVTDDMGLTATDTVDIDVVKVNRFINDTGVTISASASANDMTCVVTENKVQDCEQGRDIAAIKKVGAGAAGFDYTKLDVSGNELAANAASWSCVRDNHTGLIWEVKTTDGGFQHNLDSYQWGGKGTDGYTDGASQGTYYEDANALVKHANDNALCGKSDWALPTNEELNGLVNKGDGESLVDVSYFPNTVAVRYWTANPSAYDEGDAWAVDFGTTHANDDGPLVRTAFNRVRLVSGGEATEATYFNQLHSDSRYIISTDGTVTDLDTGLMWARCIVGQSWDNEELSCSGEQKRHTWENALESGVDNTYGGHSNWRLPNINELKTIFDITKTAPALNTVAFPAIPTGSTSYFWSTTPDLAQSVFYSLAVTTGGDIDSKPRTSSTGFVFLVRNLHD